MFETESLPLSSRENIAVVLMNLGGPADQAGVRPFLFSLFSDPRIIGLPGVFRWMLAGLIAARRAPEARAIYARMGGGSPLLANTRAQAQALEKALNQAETERESAQNFRVHLAMRHAPPFTREAVQAILDSGAERVVLLPLYPQFSTTTTLSALDAWEAEARPLDLPVHALCCYPALNGLATVWADAIVQTMKPWSSGDRKRAMLLFSAHGLPVRIVRKGDPYPEHVLQTREAVMHRVCAQLPDVDPDQAITGYQSRVGPVEWLGPSTPELIARAGAEHRPVVLVPVSFVSEHSETLVELDEEYRHLASESGVPLWHRIPTPSVHPAWIQGLVLAVRHVLALPPGIRPLVPGTCLASCRTCPCRARLLQDIS